VNRASSSLQDWFFAHDDASAAAAVRLAFAICYLFLLWDIYPVRDLLLGHSGYFGTLDARYVATGPLNALYHADSPLGIHLWFLAATVSVVLVGVGLYTRLAVVASMVCLLLLQRRNPFMLFGADLVLFNIGLWLVFLKSDRVWALDEWIRRRRGRPSSRVIPLWPLRALQIQIALLYFRTSMAKVATEPWQDGSAVYYALHAMGNDVFPAILHDKLLLTLLNYGTVLIEFSFPVLVFWRPTRWLAIVSAALLHTGIDLLMAIRFFGPVMYAALVSFVAPHEWLTLEGWVRRWTRHPRPLAAEWHVADG
jgi:hypothetical protein